MLNILGGVASQSFVSFVAYALV